MAFRCGPASAQSRWLSFRPLFLRYLGWGPKTTPGSVAQEESHRLIVQCSPLIYYCKRTLSKWCEGLENQAHTFPAFPRVSLVFSAQADNTRKVLVPGKLVKDFTGAGVAPSVGLYQESRLPKRSKASLYTTLLGMRLSHCYQGVVETTMDPGSQVPAWGHRAGYAWRAAPAWDSSAEIVYVISLWQLCANFSAYEFLFLYMLTLIAVKRGFAFLHFLFSGLQVI